MHVCCKYIKRILFASCDGASMYPALRKRRSRSSLATKFWDYSEVLETLPPTKKKGKAFLSNLGTASRGKGRTSWVWQSLCTVSTESVGSLAAEGQVGRLAGCNELEQGGKTRKVVFGGFWNEMKTWDSLKVQLQSEMKMFGLGERR